MKRSIYKSPEGEAKLLDLYDRFQAGLGVFLTDRNVSTRFGATHILVAGPAQGMPVVITHGGNSITPQGLRGVLPLLELERYRIYAPDTIGHPGKSAQIRLPSHDQSYAQWLSDVLDGLGHQSAAFIGGSFGAGIVLQMAVYAPQRITKMALVVPAGLVSVPFTSMVFKVGLPYLIYRLFPRSKQLHKATQWMGDSIEDDVMELIEAVFQHVRVEPEMPRPVTKAELAAFSAPTLVIAAQMDAMFPGDAVVKRAVDVISNLREAECLKGASHYLTMPDLDYVNERIVEFLGEA
jgi:pimeloyl-ACP methyl ester carboxylesterase